MNFFQSIGDVLPCFYCRENFCKNIKLKVVVFKYKYCKNRETLSKWLYRLHEKVNCNLGKKSGLTYNMVRSRYENFRARCLVNNKDLVKKTKGKEKRMY